MDKERCKKAFYGSTTVGEKGQVVIPIEARKALGLEPGEKLLVMGMDQETLMLIKPSKLAEYSEKLSQKLNNMQNILKESS